MEIDNPFWAEIQKAIRDQRLHYDPETRMIEPATGFDVDWNANTARFGPTIPDPNVLDYLARRMAKGVVIPDARLGYWPHLVRQYGRDVTAYDSAPPGFFTSTWGKVLKLDSRRRNLTAHFADTLLFTRASYPFELVVTCLNAYRGERMILICDQPESDGKLRDILDKEWERVSTYDGGVWVKGDPRQVHEYIKVGPEAERVDAWARMNTMLIPELRS